jgi:hypothetical protein
MVWIKRWLLFAVGVPLVAWVLDRVATSLEASRGESEVTRGLHGVAGQARRWRKRRR